jgi:hypothetical protein
LGKLEDRVIPRQATSLGLAGQVDDGMASLRIRPKTT